MLKPPPPAMPALAAGTQVTSKMLSAYTASWRIEVGQMVRLRSHYLSETTKTYSACHFCLKKDLCMM